MFLAMDIGGTWTRVAVSSKGRKLDGVKTYETPQDFHEGVRRILAAKQRLMKDGVPQGIVIACAGVVDGGVIKSTGNLPHWKKKPLAHLLASTLDCGVRLVNDAAAAGLGEATRGAGRGYDIIAYLTASTGFGGVRIVNRALDGDDRGYEPGHHVIERGGLACACGRRGCLEAYASGTAFEKRFRVKPEHCENEGVWRLFAEPFAVGLANIIAIWNPDVVVIGGGVSRAGRKLFQPLEKAVKKELTFMSPPPIRQAKLGDEAGLHGCLELLSGS